MSESEARNLPAASRLRIIVTGLIAQHHTLAGVAWDYLQYVVGLARLGHDVYYLEDSGEWPYNLDGGPTGTNYVAHDCTANVEHLARVMERFGLAGKWAYHFPIRSEWFGLPCPQRQEVLGSADLLVNVSGTLQRPEDYAQVRRLAYIDSDPVFTQVQLARGSEEFRGRVDGHHVHFSFGEKLSDAVPATGHHWRPTRQPILLSEWRTERCRRESFTTVMSWTSYKPLTYRGTIYGQKDLELRRFLDLPARVKGTELEVALGGIHHLNWEIQDISRDLEIRPLSEPSHLTPAELLSSRGWRVVDPRKFCGELDSYRDYIETSKAEWSVEKNGYVAGKPGWFSCRSACYLAAGRPVVVQDTGFSAVLPVGEGVLAFTDLEEAAAGIRAIEADYGRHSRAARSIAEEYFDSFKVLARLVEEAMESHA